MKRKRRIKKDKGDSPVDKKRRKTNKDFIVLSFIVLMLMSLIIIPKYYPKYHNEYRSATHEERVSDLPDHLFDDSTLIPHAESIMNQLNGLSLPYSSGRVIKREQLPAKIGDSAAAEFVKTKATDAIRRYDPEEVFRDENVIKSYQEGQLLNKYLGKNIIPKNKKEQSHFESAYASYQKRVVGTRHALPPVEEITPSNLDFKLENPHHFTQIQELSKSVTAAPSTGFNPITPITTSLESEIEEGIRNDRRPRKPKGLKKKKRKNYQAYQSNITDEHMLPIVSQLNNEITEEIIEIEEVRPTNQIVERRHNTQSDIFQEIINEQFILEEIDALRATHASLIDLKDGVMSKREKGKRLQRISQNFIVKIMSLVRKGRNGIKDYTLLLEVLQRVLLREIGSLEKKLNEARKFSKLIEEKIIDRILVFKENLTKLVEKEEEKKRQEKLKQSKEKGYEEDDKDNLNDFENFF